MRRYSHLNQADIYHAFNRLRDVFLSARDGNDVDKITDGLLTRDEKLKIGRRILIAEYLLAKIPMEEVVRELKVGMSTVVHVSRRLEKYSECFELIERRRKLVEKEYTGFRRKDVKRK